MIIKAKIQNFMGIENAITINCLASNKIKRENTPFATTKDDIKVLRNIGIIGSNGSGKTSILNAFATIKTFVNFPFRKSANNDESFIEKIKMLPKEMLQQIMDDFNTLKLPTANINHAKEETYVSIEMYIPEGKDKIEGYYEYSLLYDHNYQKDGIKEEKLQYRKKYNSQKKLTIFCVNNVIESELGTTLLYKNNNMNIDKDNIKYYNSIGDEIMNNMDIIFSGDYADLNTFFKEHKKLFGKLCALADEKIVEPKIEKQKKEELLVFLNKDGNKLYFEQLSEGTQKIIVLGCKIIYSIENNRILFLDELEKALHPSLAKFLVLINQRLKRDSFNQLFFTTHSSDLAMLLDNDQLYYIDNRLNEYKFFNISDAINKGIISKDKNLQRALEENLLINNPNIDKIYDFVDNIK